MTRSDRADTEGFLGINVAICKRRAAKITNRREQKALVRALRTKVLCNAAKKIVRPGLAAGLKWGMTTRGGSITLLHRHRSMMLKAACIKIKSSCPLFAARMLWPPHGDPQVATPVAMINQWARTMLKKHHLLDKGQTDVEQ